MPDIAAADFRADKNIRAARPQRAAALTGFNFSSFLIFCVYLIFTLRILLHAHFAEIHYVCLKYTNHPNV